MAITHTLLSVTAVVAALSASASAQGHCPLFETGAQCPTVKAPALRVSFGRADLPAVTAVQPVMLHGGSHVVFGQAGTARVAAPTAPRSNSPVDCRMLQPADPTIDPLMVRRTHSGVVPRARVTTVTPCPQPPAAHRVR